jgi:hypothetical protein
VDDFVSGHSLAALEHLARVVVGADARGGAYRAVARPVGAGSRAGTGGVDHGWGQEARRDA